MIIRILVIANAAFWVLDAIVALGFFRNDMSGESKRWLILTLLVSLSTAAIIETINRKSQPFR